MENLGACLRNVIEAKNRVERGQISSISQGNSEPIAQESGGICTAQTVLQPITHFVGRLLGPDAIFDEIETPEDYARVIRKKLRDIIPLFGSEPLSEEIETLTERLALYEIILEKNAIDIDSLDLDDEYREGYEKIKQYSTEWLSLLIGHLVRKE